MNASVTTKVYVIITLLVALWCAGIVAAPMLKHTGLQSSGDVAYRFFSRVCHQDDARSFHLEGEKFGVCIRCSAIYFGFLAGLLLRPLFGVLKRSTLPKRALMIAVIIPMLVDAALNVVGVHASTTLTRVATGLLFGSVMPWFIVPFLAEACSQLIDKKKIQSPDPGVSNYVRKAQ
jgi:uncharacterized membrane protein